MRAHDLKNLLNKVMGEQGFGGKPISLNIGRGRFEDIVDIVFCSECDEFHLVSELRT